MGNCQAAEAATVVVQHPGGRVERLYWATTAAEVMRANPGHYVALVTLRVAEEKRPPPPPPPPPAAHLMMSPSFFDAGVFADVGGDWMEDLMHLGELFGVGVGGDDDDNGGVDGGVGGGDDRMQEWQNNCEGAGSPDHQPSCGDGDGDGDGDVSPRDGELGDGDGDNSATRKRRDRSKTIVSERKRRVRMKEKLYELRALVPNITKMDKASIIADAVVYVKDLQAHARKLKEEVAALEEARPIRPPPPSAAAQRPQRQPRRVAAAAAQLAIDT